MFSLMLLFILSNNMRECIHFIRQNICIIHIYHINAYYSVICCRHDAVIHFGYMLQYIHTHAFSSNSSIAYVHI